MRDPVASWPSSPEFKVKTGLEGSKRTFSDRNALCTTLAARFSRSKTIRSWSSDPSFPGSCRNYRTRSCHLLRGRIHQNAQGALCETSWTYNVLGKSAYSPKTLVAQLCICHVFEDFQDKKRSRGTTPPKDLSLDPKIVLSTSTILPENSETL